MIVSVAPDYTWLTLVSDPTQSVQAWAVDRQGTDTRGGDFRATAGGGVIVVTTDDDDIEIPVNLQVVAHADYLKLRSWRGRIVLLRDSAGKRAFGSYLSVTHTEIHDPEMPNGLLYMIQIPFRQMPYSEAV